MVNGFLSIAARILALGMIIFVQMPGAALAAGEEAMKTLERLKAVHIAVGKEGECRFIGN